MDFKKEKNKDGLGSQLGLNQQPQGWKVSMLLAGLPGPPLTEGTV